MLKQPNTKYQAFSPIGLKDRTWPDKTITTPPVWCSSDLRDGNQALIEPMDPVRKKNLFQVLTTIGFQEIEVAFPSASQTDFQFVRDLIEDKLIPEGVWIQVLVQAREDLIVRTFEAVKGAKNVIVHFYNATSPLFRNVVFGNDKAATVALAVKAATVVRDLAAKAPETNWRFEYSPETFSATELDFSLEICNAVLDVWNPTPQHKAILNLPATVEVATPNIYADQIEWFGRNLKRRDSVLLSLHCHNDRGAAVAATELGLMAGADRVEGCLFGNGERTGNVDLITLALNLYTQGIDPGLRFADIDEIRRFYEESTQMPVHPRHPYAGDLVFTAFSGSHQDAIKKGFSAQKTTALWNVPYLPLDPKDLGRSYDAVIRVNSQSGKGGISYLLEKEYGLVLPRRLSIEFSKVVQQHTDTTGKEVTAAHLHEIFTKEYFEVSSPYAYKSHHLSDDPVGKNAVRFTLEADVDGVFHTFHGVGEGPIEAVVKSLPDEVKLMDYSEYSLGGKGAASQAVAFIELRIGESGPVVWGVGVDRNTVTASIRALLSGVNRARSL
ncbi:MAG: 2-isopropylmalate synthase [Spirochaetales bacterium]